MKKENKDSNGREELEKYVRENCCLHILSLLGQNPDDPITNKDFRYFVTFIADVISQEKEKWVKQTEKDIIKIIEEWTSTPDEEAKMKTYVADYFNLLQNK